MGQGSAQDVINDPLHRFAQRLRLEHGAERVLLFGSRARGTERFDSDYDLMIVSPIFNAVEPWARGRGLRRLFREEGGVGGMDLVCLTPAEFDQARNRISLVAAVLPEAIDLLAPQQPAA
jgi:predicted nucleotidyltransferase